MRHAVEKRSIRVKSQPAKKERGRQTVVLSDLFEIEVPARSENLGRARQAVASVAESLHLTAEDTCDLLLAVGEACNNAVQHGSGSTNGALQVRCRLRSKSHRPQSLQVEIANTGNGFLPKKNDPIFSMPKAQDFAGHGRGLPLMHRLMDDVQIFCENGNTVVRLTKRISG